jgi:molybdopterin-binding protein
MNKIAFASIAAGLTVTAACTQQSAQQLKLKP